MDSTTRVSLGERRRRAIVPFRADDNDLKPSASLVVKASEEASMSSTSTLIYSPVLWAS